MAGTGAGAMVEEVSTGLAAGAADAMVAKAGQPPGDCTSSQGPARSGHPIARSGAWQPTTVGEERWATRVWSLVESREEASQTGFGPAAGRHCGTATRPGAGCDGGHQRPRTRRVGGGAESPSCRLGK